MNEYEKFTSDEKPFPEVLEAVKKITTAFGEGAVTFYDECEEEWLDEETVRLNMKGMPLISLYLHSISRRIRKEGWELQLWLEIPTTPTTPGNPSMNEVFEQSPLYPLFQKLYCGYDTQNYALQQGTIETIEKDAEIISDVLRLYGYENAAGININIQGEFDHDRYMTEASIVVIPDVHGRSFWKNAVAKYPDNRVIFLGDYHDPYPDEGISEEASLQNFKEIIEFAKDNNNCTLLLGNHDLHYLCDFNEACRYDYDNAAEIKRLLTDNLYRFSLLAHSDMQGKTIVFSHAPILKEWLDSLGYEDKVATLLFAMDRLLQTIKTAPFHVADALGNTTPFRGGYDEFGSIVWADARELEYNHIIYSADYSIFGHTQLKRAAITDRWACLDCRQAFLLRPDLQIIPIK